MILPMERLKSAGASLALVVLVAGCGSAQAGDPLAPDVVDAEPSVWAATGLPYGVSLYSDWVTLSYRDVSVRLPATNEAWTEEAKRRGEFTPNEPPLLRLLSASATADTAIFALQPPYADAADVYRLTEAGDWARIGTDLHGIPLADIGGHLAVWAEKRSDGVHLVGYDTKQGRVVDTVPPADLVDVDGSVFPTSVDGDVAIIQQEVPGEGNSRPFGWAVGSDPVPVDNLAAGDWITAHSSETGLRSVWTPLTENTRLVSADGSVVAPALGQDQIGLFNPDGSLLVRGSYLRDRGVYDPVAGQGIALDLPAKFRHGTYAWTADDRLLVQGLPRGFYSNADGSGHFAPVRPHDYLCTPETGACEDLGEDLFPQQTDDVYSQLSALRGPESEGE